MWVFFENGTFYSAVQDKVEPDYKNVRSRDRRSSEILAKWASDKSGEEVEVIETKHADYHYRVMVTHAEWTDFVAEQAANAKATNFKSEVAKNIGYTEGSKFLSALHDVWQVMYDFQHSINRKVMSKGSGYFHTYSTPEPVSLEEFDFDYDEVTENAAYLDRHSKYNDFPCGGAL